MSDLARCIDCSKRKKCKKVRVNKYKKFTCQDFMIDIEKQARHNQHMANVVQKDR